MAGILLLNKNMSKKWSTEIPWVKDSNYIIRCIEETFGQSKSSGKPMITLKFEVVQPETMEVNGEAVDIAGVSYGLTQYYVTKSIDENGDVDMDKTANIKQRLERLYAAFGLDFSSFNSDNPTLGFKNKTVYAWIENSCVEQRKSPTAAQAAAGQRQGDVLINPVTKKPLLNNQPVIREIFGLADVGATQAY
jgi:hypothetical protein